MPSKPSRFNVAVSSSICIMIIIIIITISFLLLSSAAAAADTKADDLRHHYKDFHKGRPFRCFRPFSSLRSFTPRDMTKKENCEFAPFMTVIDAKAKVNCYKKEDHENNNSNNVGDRSAEQQTEEQKDGCYVTLNFTAHKFDPKNPNYHPAQFEKFFRDQQQANNNDTLDSLRYGIELKALGHSTIRYKGFENKGYSACCSMLKRGDGEDICEWTEQTKQNNENEEDNTNSSDGVVDKIHFHRVKSQTSCPLNDPAYDQQILDGRKVYGKVIEGEITRPLHRKVYGRWEARIEFYKDDVTNGIGRIIVPFEMKAEDDDQFVAESLSSSSSSSVSKSKEMGSENTNNVAVVSVGKKSNEEEK